MKDVDAKVLSSLLEAPDVEAPEGWANALSARLAASDGPEIEDALALAPEADPELAEVSVGVWLRDEVRDATSERDWHSFRSAIEARLGEPAEAADLEALAPEQASPSIPQLLEEERDELLENMHGHWTAFGAQIEDRFVWSSAAVDQQAVEQLKGEIEDEVHAMGPRFDVRFQRELQARLDAPTGARAWWAKLQDWWKAPSRSSWGLGLGMATAMVALIGVRFASVETGSQPVPLAELHGEVSVEAIDFDGDVVVIQDEGVTMVVLSGV